MELSQLILGGFFYETQLRVKKTIIFTGAFSILG